MKIFFVHYIKLRVQTTFKTKFMNLLLKEKLNFNGQQVCNNFVFWIMYVDSLQFVKKKIIQSCLLILEIARNCLYCGNIYI